MALTLYEAMKASQNAYQAELLKQIATTDDMFAICPWVPKLGEGFSYEREVSLGSFGAIAPGGSVNESTGKTEKVTISNREFSADFYVPNFAQSLMSDRVSQLERQTMMKLKAAGRTLAGKMITGGSISSATVDAFDTGAYVDALVAASPFIRDREGPGELKYTHSGTLLQFRAPGDPEFGDAVACTTDGNYTLASKDPSKWITVTLDVSDATANQTRRIAFTASNEFDGLQNQCASSQVRSASGNDGDALSFPILEELVDAVKNRSGQLAFVMHSKVRRKYNALVRATGGTDPGFVMEGPLGKLTLPSFAGIPILTNDNVPVNESKGSASTLSSVYLANFADGEGVYMGAYGSGRQEVDADPRDVSVLGFQIFELGQKEGESKQGRRLCWFGGMACGSDLSLARAKNIITA